MPHTCPRETILLDMMMVDLNNKTSSSLLSKNNGPNEQAIACSMTKLCYASRTCMGLSALINARLALINEPGLVCLDVGNSDKYEVIYH